jgi:hypothetical protein
MLSAIGFLFKFALFSVAILVMGNWVQWDGETLSERVQAQLSHAERSDVAAQLRGWTKKITDDARGGVDKKARSRGHVTHAQRSPDRHVEASSLSDRTETTAAAPQHTANPDNAGHAATTVATEEQIPSSERQKLRALMRELNNTTHDRD